LRGKFFSEFLAEQKPAARNSASEKISGLPEFTMAMVLLAGREGLRSLAAMFCFVLFFRKCANHRASCLSAESACFAGERLSQPYAT